MLKKTPAPASTCLCCWKGCSCPSCLPLPLSCPSCLSLPLLPAPSQPTGSSPAGKDSSSLYQSFRLLIFLLLYFLVFKPKAPCSFGVGQPQSLQRNPCPNSHGNGYGIIIRAEKVPPRSPSGSFVCSDLLPPSVETSGLSLPGQAGLARAVFPELGRLAAAPHPLSGMQDASAAQSAPRFLGNCDTGTRLSRRKLEAFPYRPAGPLVERVRLVPAVLTQAGNRSSDAGGRSGDEFGTRGGKLSQKEPQEQRQGWAGPFWELRLPSCKWPGGAGTQPGTAAGPHEQGNAARTGPLAARRARAGSGREGYGAARPLCSSARTWQKQGRACPWLAPSRARGVLAPHRAGRTGALGHTPAQAHTAGRGAG